MPAKLIDHGPMLGSEAAMLSERVSRARGQVSYLAEEYRAEYESFDPDRLYLQKLRVMLADARRHCRAVECGD